MLFISVKQGRILLLIRFFQMGYVCVCQKDQYELICISLNGNRANQT